MPKTDDEFFTDPDSWSLSEKTGETHKLTEADLMLHWPQRKIVKIDWDKWRFIVGRDVS